MPSLRWSSNSMGSASLNLFLLSIDFNQLRKIETFLAHRTNRFSLPHQAIAFCKQKKKKWWGIPLWPIRPCLEMFFRHIGTPGLI